MKRPSMKSDPATEIEAGSALGRRGVLLGSGAVALAGVAGVVASRNAPTEMAEVQPKARPEGEADGYRLTAHVRRYYETIRV